LFDYFNKIKLRKKLFYLKSFLLKNYLCLGSPRFLSLVQENTTVLIDYNLSGYVNLSKIFLLSKKKKFFDWYRTLRTKRFLDTLALEFGIIPLKLFSNIQKGGKKVNRFIYVHPQVAMDVLNYIFIEFYSVINSWLISILVSPHVNLSIKSLSYQKVVSSLLGTSNELVLLKKKHNSLLYKRQYHKFNKTLVFYIFSLFDRKHYKCGICEGPNSTIDSTLSTYRRLYGNIKVEKLLYFSSLNDLRHFESSFFRACENQKIFLNHEQLIFMDISSLLEKLNVLISFECYEGKFNYATQESMDLYNNGL
jgi:hypothetical protein